MPGGAEPGHAGALGRVAGTGTGACAAHSEGAEMIIAGQAPGPGDQTQATVLATALDQGFRGNNDKVRERVHRHERRPAQRRDLGISQYETVT